MRKTTLTALLVATILACPPLVMATPTTVQDAPAAGCSADIFPHADSLGSPYIDILNVAVDFSIGAHTIGSPAGDWPGSGRPGLQGAMSSSLEAAEERNSAAFPEPANMLVFGAGLVGLGGLAGGSKRKKLPASNSRAASSPSGGNGDKGKFPLQPQSSQALAGLPL